MGQIAVLKSPKPLSKLQKVVAVLTVVAIGHVSALYVLAQMKPIQLKKIETTKPIQVKFVKIVEPPKPKPPKPEPPKPKEPPKPTEVKIVEKPLPPKKVEKVQQVKADIPQEKLVTDVPQPEVKVVTTPVVVVKEDVKEPVVPKVDTTTPRQVDANTVAWKRKPKPKLVESDLKCVSSNMIVIRMDVDVKGNIKARALQKSGCDKVDKEFVRAVQSAQLYPYLENGIAVPFYADQSFALK